MSMIAFPTVRPSVPTKVATPKDLLHMEDRGLLELADGRLVEKKMSYTANLVAGRMAFVLNSAAWASTPAAGDVLPEQSFQCFPRKPEQVRRPAVAFILASRRPAVAPVGHVNTVPDIAVEVVSPTDNVYELDEKLADYQSAGIPLVWVVNPEARVIRVHRPGKPIDELHDGDVLNAQPVLPGFLAKVTDLLPAITQKIP